MADDVRLIIDGAEMQELLRGPTGPVVKHTIRLADKVIPKARRKIHDRTGALARSIVKRPSTGPGGFEMVIAAEKRYAFWVHEGNGPPGPRIYPTSHRFLRFVPSVPFRPVYVKSVRASKANPFLRDALVEVMAEER